MSTRFGTAVRLWGTALLVAGMGVVGSASATLLDRGPDMVYDNVLNITWTRNANLPGSQNLNWAAANAWAAGLVFAGFSDWRLPWASVSAGAGPTALVHFCTGAGGADETACQDNEMGYMYYYNLDGTLGDNKTGTQTALGGEVLTGIQPVYWSGTEFNSNTAWSFLFFSGSQDRPDELGQFSAWAVRPGDVIAAAPEPASLLLFGVGLAGFFFSRRK